MSDAYEQAVLLITFRMVKKEDEDHMCVDLSMCLHVFF